MTIAIGQLVLVPGQGLARVFANHNRHIGVETLPRHELIWIEEKVVCPPEEPTSEEIAYG